MCIRDRINIIQAPKASRHPMSVKLATTSFMTNLTEEERVIVFDTIDDIFGVLSGILEKLIQGYFRYSKKYTPFDYFSFMDRNMDVLCTLIFFESFPVDLRDTLVEKLNIDKKSLKKALLYCDKGIFYKNKMCNYSSSTVTREYHELKSSEGFKYLTSILVTLRGFKHDGLV